MQTGQDEAGFSLIAARTWPRRIHVPRHAAPRRSSASRRHIQIIGASIIVLAAATLILILTRSNWTRLSYRGAHKRMLVSLMTSTPPD